jgi:hypothetical protein
VITCRARRKKNHTGKGREADEFHLMFQSMLVVLKKTRRIYFQLSMVSWKSQHGAGLMHNLQSGELLSDHY